MPWHPSFALNLPDLDAQHQYFVALLDYLDIACQLDNKAQIELLLVELRRYARYHFSSEELLMHAYDYPAETQRREHRELLAELDEMLQNPTYSRAKLLLFVFKWLINHIQVEDAQLAKYVLEKRKSFLEPLDTPTAPQLRLTAAANEK